MRPPRWYQTKLAPRKTYRFALSMLFGDQTVLSVADVLMPDEMKRLFILLPCLMAWVSTAAYLLQRRGGGSSAPPTRAPTPTRAPALSLSMTPDT